MDFAISVRPNALMTTTASDVKCIFAQIAIRVSKWATMSQTITEATNALGEFIAR